MLKTRLNLLRLITALLADSRLSSEAHAEPKRPRLILIIVADTLRADHLKAYGYGRDTMPGLERLMASGTTFVQSYSSAGHTQPSVSSLLTGLRPAVHGYYNFHEPKRRALDLPTWVRGRGYFAASVNANPNTQWFSSSYDYAWTDQPPRGYFTAERIVAEAKTAVAKAGDRDLFLYVQFADPHLPYDPPVYEPSFFVGDAIGKKFDPRFSGIQDTRTDEITPGILANMRNRYDATIHYMDSQLSPFVAELLRRYPEHLVVFTADHGEAFLEHGEAGHGRAMYNTVIRVPLMVMDSSVRKGVHRSGALVTGVDLFPTVLERLGGEKGSVKTQGKSFLWALTHRQGAGGRTAVVESPYYRDDDLADGDCWGLAYFHQPRWGLESGTVVKLTTTGTKCGAIKRSVVHRDAWFDAHRDKAQKNQLRPKAAGASALDPHFQRSWILPPLAIEGRVVKPTPEEIEKLKALGYIGTD
jgi:arylsulfatase